MGFFNRLFGWFRKKSANAGDHLDLNQAIKSFQRGNYQEALRRVEVILIALPNIGVIHRFKGECLIKLERNDEANSCFSRAFFLGGPGTEDLWPRTASEHEASQPQHLRDRKCPSCNGRTGSLGGRICNRCLGSGFLSE